MLAFNHSIVALVPIFILLTFVSCSPTFSGGHNEIIINSTELQEHPQVLPRTSVQINITVSSKESSEEELVHDPSKHTEIFFRLFHEDTKNFLLVQRENKFCDPEDYDLFPKRPTKLIVHGFLDSGYSEWQELLSLALKEAGDFNVYVIDWASRARRSYFEASNGARLVGKRIANYILLLRKQYGMKIKDFHCIGHGLGAQACGFAGQELRGRLGRITALNPAAPEFFGVSEENRLDPSDAQFVDVIHTDVLGLFLGYGMKDACGHIDFYPNNGMQQPGCSQDKLWIRIPGNIFNSRNREIHACHHYRAIYLFLDSVRRHRYKNGCSYIGHICPNYYIYEEDRCNSCGEDDSQCASMGLDADKFPLGDRKHLKFYLSTGDAYPHCNVSDRLKGQAARRLTESHGSKQKGHVKITITNKRTSSASSNNVF